MEGGIEEGRKGEEMVGGYFEEEGGTEGGAMDGCRSLE